MKKNYLLSVFISLSALVFFIFSYYLKRKTGSLLHALIIVVLLIGFIGFSIATIIKCKKIWLGIFLCVVSITLFVIFKYHLEDDFAANIELPEIEKEITEAEQSNGKSKYLDNVDDLWIYKWEPGFLDYQQVVVYDEKDELESLSKKDISTGHLYVLKKIKPNFYFCTLYD